MGGHTSLEHVLLLVIRAGRVGNRILVMKDLVATVNELESVHAFRGQDGWMLDHIVCLLTVCETEHLRVLCHILISAV